MRRYPLAALIDASGLSEHALGQRVGLSGTPLIRARRNGLIESAADKYACRLGLVPWLVWSDWLDDAWVKCAAEQCTNQFVPSRKGHRFCSTACYQRDWKARWFRDRYAQDPKFREAQRERAKAYRARSAKALKVKQQAWKAANADRQREYRRAYYLANRERLLAKQREYDRARKAA